MKIPKARRLSSGKYHIQLRIGGQSVSITELTEEKCVKKAIEIKTRWENSVEKDLIKRERTTSIVNPTLYQAIDRYISKRQNVLSPSTVRGYRSIQKLYYKRYMDRRILDIDYQLMVNEEALTYSPKTIRNGFALIRSSVSEYGIDLSNIHLPQMICQERRWLDAEQIPIFLKAIEGRPCELIALLALHSLRRSEILALEKKDITDTHIIVHGSAVIDENYKLVQKKTNKNSSSFREVPIMIPRLKELAEQLPEGIIFPKNTNHYKITIDRICKTLGFAPVGLHGLRHSFCSLAYSLGIDEKTTMAIGGWSDYNTMRKIYTHISQTNIDSSVEKMKDYYKSC